MPEVPYYICQLDARHKTRDTQPKDRRLKSLILEPREGVKRKSARVEREREREREI